MHGGALDAVGPHLGEAGHRLAHHRQRVGHHRPHPVVVALQDALEPQQDQGVDDDGHHHEGGQPPLVHGHGRDGDQHLRDVDDEHHPAPLGELLHGADVRRHPRDQGSPALGLDVEDGARDQLREHLDPEIGETGGGLTSQAHHRLASQGGSQHQHHRRQQGLGEDGRHVDLASGDVAVHRLLHQHRHQDLDEGAGSVHQQDQPQAMAQHRGLDEGPTEDGHGRDVAVVGQEHRFAGHRAASRLRSAASSS